MASNKTISLKVSSAEETLNIGKSLGKKLKGGEVVELAGDLGSGKTTLVKALTAGSGSHELASSPSFTICNEYKAKNFKIYHFDFYRLAEPGIIRLELAEVMADATSVIVIEWPEVIENILPPKRLVVRLSVTDENSRTITIDYPEELSYLIEALE